MRQARQSQIAPEYLKELEYEEQYSRSSGNQSRRVKIDKGHTWLIRFLPAKMGDKKLWYARIVRHWLDRKFITCPAGTHPSFGGDPNAICPCCEVAHQLNGSSDKAISNIGYKASATPQWMTWCLVFEKDGIACAAADQLVPYEFWHYKKTWDMLLPIYKSNATVSPDSVLDYDTGNDFMVSHTASSWVLDKQNSTPIFDPSDARFDEYIKKVEAGLRAPKFPRPTDEQLNAFADKIDEAASMVENGHPRTFSRPAYAEDADDNNGEQGEPEAEEAAPLPRVSSRPAPPPARTASPRAAAPAAAPTATTRRAAAKPAPAPAPEPEAEPEAPAAEPEPAEQPVPKTRQVAVSTSSRRVTNVPAGRVAPPGPVDDEPDATVAEAASEAEAEEAAAQPEPPPAPRTSRTTGAPSAKAAVGVAAAATRRSASAPAAPSAPAGEDDQEEFPEESTDAAPPEPLAPETPPEVSRTGATGGALGKITAASLRNRVAGLRQG